MQKRYVLLDDDGQPVRYYDYPAEYAVEILASKPTFDELLNEVGDCLL